MTTNVRPDLATQTAPAGNQTQADPHFEQRVVALQRRERELTKREQGLNGAMTLDQMKEAIRKDKAGFLKGLGIELPADPNEDVPDHIREFKELKAQIETERKQTEQQKYRDSILANVKGNDKYELLNSLEAYDDAFNRIDQMRESGEEFDPYSVFDEHENATYAQLERVKASKKLSPWFEPKAPEPSQPVERGYQRHPMDVSRTVTGQDRPSVSSQEQPSNKLLSKEESLRQLAQKYGNPPKQGQ